MPLRKLLQDRAESKAGVPAKDQDVCTFHPFAKGMLVEMSREHHPLLSEDETSNWAEDETSSRGPHAQKEAQLAHNPFLCFHTL
eukprot:4471156-Amphidinium_carterae.1